MRLLFVIDSLGPGGAQRQLVNLAGVLQQRGHRIEFFTYYPHDHFASALQGWGIPVYFEPKRQRFSLNVPRSLRRRLRTGRYDLALSFLDTPNFYAEVARVGCPGLKLVVSERFCDPPAGPSFRRRALIQGHRLADYVTVNSHHQRRSLSERHGWLADKLTTIYNGIDLALFQPRQTSMQTSSSLRLLVVASVSFYKNGLVLIRALEVLKRRYGIHAEVSWIGEHQLHLPDRRDCCAQMHALIAELGLESQWTWRHVSKEIPELMRTHDALVHPSYFEGLPNVVCEALASGLPIVASNVLDHPHLVKDGDRGFLFAWNSPEDLAAKLSQLYQMSAQARWEMGRRCRAYAEAELALERFADRYERLFRTLCGLA